jgi:hypothetical protein
MSSAVSMAWGENDCTVFFHLRFRNFFRRGRWRGRQSMGGWGRYESVKKFQKPYIDRWKVKKNCNFMMISKFLFCVSQFHIEQIEHLLSFLLFHIYKCITQRVGGRAREIVGLLAAPSRETERRGPTRLLAQLAGRWGPII